MANVGTAVVSKSVAVVDDDESTRLYLRDILQSAKNFRFAGSFSNATEALTGIPRLQPDLTLMDIHLPDLNGVACVRRLQRDMPGLKIIILTGATEEDWVSVSLQAGVTAYLVKPFEVSQLLATLEFAAVKRRGIMLNVHERMPRLVSKDQFAGNILLSTREKDVLKGLAEGLLYKEISDKLGISYSAVHKCQHNIFKKLHVANRSEAIRIWLDGQNS